MQTQLGSYATVRRWATDRSNVLKRACVPELWFSGVGSLVLEWIWGGWDLGPRCENVGGAGETARQDQLVPVHDWRQ